MDIQFYGANCVVVGGKHSRIVIDDNLAELGAKPVTKDDDISLFTGNHQEDKHALKLMIDQPGEYEVAGVSVYGIAARAHMDTDDKKTATVYKLVFDDMNMLVVGHIYPELSDDQLEAIGTVDVMLVPVGGNGYTLDGLGALKLIKKIEPKLVIPTHYDDPALNFPVPQQPLDQALKAMAMEPKETTAKLKLKSTDLTDVTQLIVLEKS